MIMESALLDDVHIGLFYYLAVNEEWDTIFLIRGIYLTSFFI